MSKALIIIISTIFITLSCLGQGRSISFNKKIKSPIVLTSKDTIKIGDIIELQEGTLESGNFKFVQLLNKMNEPIKLANSRFSFTKQPIKFFKEQDGTFYVFTKFYCINIENAVRSGEVKCNTIKKLTKGVGDKQVSADKYNKIKELKQMLEDGVLTKDEFETEKKKILNSK